MSTGATRTAFDVWSSPTPEELQTADPMSLVPRVMVDYSNKQGDLLRLLTKNVTDLSDQISKVSDLMDIVNTGMGSLKTKTDGDGYDIATKLTDADARKELDRWVAAGGMPAYGALTFNAAANAWQYGDGTTGVAARETDPGPPMLFKVFFQKAGGEALQKNLQNKVNDLTTSNQQAQLVLQTIMGRYNATIDVVSSVINKNSRQLESLLNNFRK